MGTWNFTYDSLIRLSKGTLAQFSCDMNPADSAFNGFQPTNDYILGPSDEQVAEMGVGGSTDGSASSGLVWLHSNIWAGGKLLGTYDGGAGILSVDTTYGLHFYFNDPLGTRRVQTDYAGVVEQTCQSLPYGDGETCAATPTENLFTGKERDAETNNDYFDARYYRSALGRFMTPDWSAKVEPVPYAKMGDPQSLNLYAYMMNNPLGGVDADGHSDAAWDAYNLGPQSFNGPTGNGFALVGVQLPNSEDEFAHAPAWPQVESVAVQAQSGDQLQNTNQSQQNQSDKPSFSITASDGNLQLVNGNGSTVADYKYTTGMNGDTNQSDAGKGPIPSGKYTLDPKEISKAGFFRRFIDPRDWGDYRAPLHPEAGTDTHGRSGFFLHGGWLRLGSEGCIKVNDLNQNRLFQLLQNSRGPVEVTVQ